MKLPIDLPLVAVQWTDAHGSSANERLTEADKETQHQPAFMLSLGWLLWQDEKGVTIVSEACIGENEWRGRSFIPAPLIQSITPLAVARKKKPKTEKLVSGISECK